MKDPIIPLYDASPLYLAKAEGCHLIDENGKEYLDFESGVWCSNVGHSHERLTKVLSGQAQKCFHQGYRFRHKLADDLSIKLQELVGFKDGASVFLSSGSEAVNLSITLARHLTGKKKILKIDNSYLSAYGFGRIDKENEFLVNIKCNNLDGIEEIDYNEVGALVLETGGASLGVVKSPEFDFVKKLVEAARKYHCLVIAEEVTTGFGRTGKWFGFQPYDLNPDMVVLGKALGNGYPISAVVVDSKVVNQLESNPLRYAQSHQNDPLGCAVGLEVIKIIEEDKLIQRSQEMGNYFAEQLNKLKDKHPDKIKQVRARGLMLAMEFKEEIDGSALCHELFKAGFVVGFKFNTFRFMPPLIITKEEVDQVINRLNELLVV